MVKSAIAGLFLCALAIGVTDSSTVNAEALTIAKITETQQPLTEVLQESVDSDRAKKSEADPVTQPEIVSHMVQPGESLSKIASNYQTTWKRLFNKNVNIADPDVITIGQTIIVPGTDEVLTERPLPQLTTTPPAAEPTSRAIATTKIAARGGTGTMSSYAGSQASSTGNRYSPGYCTWYVKNMRPDLPNNLGNANTWVSRAAAQGIATGSTPKAGAVGQRGMHVVYVESVNADGTVTISEMNHKGLYVRTVRTLPANYFTYIY